MFTLLHPRHFSGARDLTRLDKQIAMNRYYTDILTVNGVTKTYHCQTILDNVVRQGEVLAFWDVMEQEKQHCEKKERAFSQYSKWISMTSATGTYPIFR